MLLLPYHGYSTNMTRRSLHQLVYFAARVVTNNSMQRMQHSCRNITCSVSRQAVSYGKHSPASDVWSYGIVLYEIWTVGERPYGTEWTNDYVIHRVQSGYRLPPPPGCSRPIYKLMIDCW